MSFKYKDKIDNEALTAFTLNEPNGYRGRFRAGVKKGCEEFVGYINQLNPSEKYQFDVQNLGQPPVKASFGSLQALPCPLTHVLVHYENYAFDPQEADPLAIGDGSLAAAFTGRTDYVAGPGEEEAYGLYICQAGISNQAFNEPLTVNLKPHIHPPGVSDGWIFTVKNAALKMEMLYRELINYKKMDKRELIKSIRDKLNIEGYEADSKGAGVVSLRKTCKDSINQILFSYKKYPGEYVLAPYLTGWKSFNAIENILERYYDSVGIDQPLVTIYLISRRIERIGEIVIRSNEDIDKVVPYLRELIEEEIMPFFRDYITLQDAYFHVLKYNNDYSKINKFLFSPQPIRRIILNRLCDNPNWQEYGQSVFDGFKKASTGPQAKIYEGYIKFLPSLLEELALIKPIC